MPNPHEKKEYNFCEFIKKKMWHDVTFSPFDLLLG